MFGSLSFCKDGIESQAVRRAMEFEIPYVIEIREFPIQQRCGKEWHSPCSISILRETETRAAFGGELDAEKG